MNSTRFLDFLKDLIRDVKGKIFLVVDNVSYHKSAETMEWVKNHENRIELFYLPGYSPDLNPDEWVWKNVKNDNVASIVPDRPGQLFEIAEKALRMLWDHRRKSGHSSPIRTSHIFAARMPKLTDPLKT